MRLVCRAAITGALLLPALTASVQGQFWRWDLGVNGGYSWHSRALDQDELGLAGENDDVRFEAGPLLGAQLTYWLSPRFGLRANAAYADRDLTASNESDTQAELVPHVNLWSGSGDLLVRLRPPSDTWNGTEILPYLALGAGVRWHNPAGDAVNCRDTTDDRQWSCAPFSLATASGTSDFALGERRTLLGLLGVGADVRLSPGFALRLEVNDRISKPRIYDADPLEGIVDLPDGDESIARLVHEIGAQAGLHVLLGRSRPELPAPEPAPAAPLPVQPAPVQPEPPREDPVSVCVIDPTAPGGIRQQGALFLHATGDTVALVAGNRVPLREAVGPVPVATGAGWYVRGEPLTLNADGHQLQYLAYQGPVQMPAEQLTFLGTIAGYPLYANRAETAGLETDLAALRTAVATNSLETVLVGRDDVRTRLETIRMLYVPLETTGCNFQAVQLLEQVRKGR